MLNRAIGRRWFLGQVAATAPGLLAFTPPANEPDDAVFAAARRQFLFPESVTYCNTGTLGASPREVVEALTGGIRQLEEGLPDWPYFQSDGEPLTGYQRLAEFRTEVGAFINAALEETAFTQNCTIGMSMLANGLDLAAGDEVITTNQEHGGGIASWRLKAKRQGIVVKELPLIPAPASGPEGVIKQFADAMTPKTRVVVFSQITSSLGMRLPAQELCALARERGAFSIIDGAQAVGQIRVDVKALGCDAYVTSPHKWLLGPKGTGILYVRREAQPKVWSTLTNGGFDDLSSGAFRFMQYGTGSLPVVHGLRAAIRFMNRIGMDRIERWDAMLSKRLRDGLARIPSVYFSSPTDPRFASAITTFGVKGKTGRQLQDALWTKKIRVRAQGDRGVRLSAHLYVSPADIDRVLEVVSSLG